MAKNRKRFKEVELSLQRVRELLAAIQQSSQQPVVEKKKRKAREPEEDGAQIHRQRLLEETERLHEFIQSNNIPLRTVQGMCHELGMVYRGDRWFSNFSLRSS